MPGDVDHSAPNPAPNSAPAPEPVAANRPARICAILAGGASRRMGTPKTTIELAGRPLVSYPVAAARAAGLRPVVVVKVMTPMPPLDCDFVTEPESPRHPAAGIVAALERLDEPLVVMPCDLPLLGPGILGELAGHEGNLVTVETQPLLGRYTPAILGKVWEALAEAQSMQAIIESLGTDVLAGPPEPQLQNINTPEDLQAAEAALGGPAPA